MKLLLALVLVLGCSCKKSEKKDVKGTPTVQTDGQPKDKDDPKPCLDPGKGACNWASCGGNSMQINAFPVHGMRPDGECNKEQIQLMPGSMEGGGDTKDKCNDKTLDVEKVDTPPGEVVKYVLVGKDSTGKCEGKDLVGAKFTVRGFNGSEQIEITEVTEYLHPSGKKFPAYRMEWVKETDKDLGGKRKQLCAKEGQKLRHALIKDKMMWSEDIPDGDELVIPVVSELYDLAGNAIPPDTNWQNKSAEWNHLACVADALAKRSINNQLIPDKEKESRAALRMWTADYCGGRPFTVRGKMIDWGATGDLVVETQWDENGATCLTRPRIIFENGVEKVPSLQTKLLKDMCPQCPGIEDWVTAAESCKPDNNFFHRDEKLKDCPATCVPPKCLIRSRNVK